MGKKEERFEKIYEQGTINSIECRCRCVYYCGKTF